MADRIARRRVLVAVAVAVAVHALLAVGVWMIVSAPEPTAPVGLPLTADADRPFRLALRTDGDHAPREKPPVIVTAPPVPTATSPAPPTGRPPVRPPVRDPLSDSIRDRIAARVNRPPEPVAAPARVPVVEVADVTPVDHHEPVPPVAVTDVSVKPTAEAKASAAAKAVTAAGQPLHGPMPDGKRVVYVLDRSTSMADRDTFLAARGAVAASAGGSFQVVVYNGKAQPLLAGTGGEMLTAKPETLRAVAEALAILKPEGRSDHAAGLRAALRFQPDFVLIVTDADDDELAKLPPILKGAEHPVEAYVARAANGTVAKPERLR